MSIGTDMHRRQIWNLAFDGIVDADVNLAGKQMLSGCSVVTACDADSAMRAGEGERFEIRGVAFRARTASTA